MNLDAIALAQYMNTTDRLHAAYQLRSRAYRWAAAQDTTAGLLAALETVAWTETLHRNECAANANPS